MPTFICLAVHHVPAVRLESDHLLERLSLPECSERMRKSVMMAPLKHTILRQEWENIWLPLCLLQTFVCLLSMSTTTLKTFTQMLLLALGSRARSFPDEAVRAGAVMEHLIHGTGPFPGCCCGLLHPHCSHQSADISDHTKMYKYNTKAVILTAQCHLISVLVVTKLLALYFFMQLFPFFPTNAAVTLPCRCCSTTKLCSKCIEIKNKKSAVIAHLCDLSAQYYICMLT